MPKPTGAAQHRFALALSCLGQPSTAAKPQPRPHVHTWNGAGKCKTAQEVLCFLQFPKVPCSLLRAPEVPIDRTTIEAYHP
eukprot:7547761-Alexandrium_andersonii.AAC.1